MKNLDVELKDDTSMASASHTNDEKEEACLAGGGQNVDSDEESTLKLSYKIIKNKSKNVRVQKSTVKNIRKEEYDIPQHLDLLTKWTIPKISPRIIYQMGTFEKLVLKQVVNTTEETIIIDSDNQTFRLLSDNDLAPYRDIYRFMHIDLVQVAFKPLTLQGLLESFIAALRDGRNHNWKKSLIGTIQTSLVYGPVYFNAYPNLQISLQDGNSLSSLILNVKLHGYDYMPGTEVVVTRRPIKWEEIDFPQEWVIENAT
ncbi:hypothetical protein H5410_061458 [Solanum commersonii]|uniref:Uncharacterized protein n=1 Tax=Solanum commersonii TaxID=4109 RepID=A0A9J5W8X4_SOLCO|nr:hypothetical protein H5410_061458 [Solanum commersonii]